MRILVPYASMGMAVVLMVVGGSTIAPAGLKIVFLGGAFALVVTAAVLWAVQGAAALRTIAKCGITGAAVSGVLLFVLLLVAPWSSGGDGEAQVTVLRQPVPPIVGVLAGALFAAVLSALIGALGYGLSHVALRERHAGSPM